MNNNSKNNEMSHLKAGKLPYESPELDVYEYVVERGFQESPQAAIARMETVSEVQDQTIDGGTGENYHGEWF